MLFRSRDEEQTARRYLDMCGLQVRDVPYADNFQLELLYSLLNRRTAANTRLSAGVFDMVSHVAGVGDDEWENLIDGSGYDDAE